MRWNDSKTYLYTGFDGFSDADTAEAYNRLMEDSGFRNTLRLFLLKRGDQSWREPLLATTSLVPLLQKQYPTMPELKYYEIAIRIIDDWNKDSKNSW